MKAPHVYDKAKYHFETVQQYGLTEEHAFNHTVFFLRWLIEHGLMSRFFVEESGDVLEKFRNSSASIHEVYESWDRCLLDDMLSEEGNNFAMHYFDFDKGKYLRDYTKALQGSLQSEFHVEYNEENYQRLKEVIDRRFKEWKSPKNGWWPS
ncbi:MAG: hypothetical protein HY040_05190 [Planctomycetes bacterium]|nr:hypothetical protein [Planctomycetota bacterium]